MRPPGRPIGGGLAIAAWELERQGDSQTERERRQRERERERESSCRELYLV
jgi:hypothetical protein